ARGRPVANGCAHGLAAPPRHARTALRVSGQGIPLRCRVATKEGLNMIDPKWAWSAYAPSPDNPWDLKKAGHLHRRAGFGASWEDLQLTLLSGPQTAVDHVLKSPAPSAEFAKTAEVMNRAARANMNLARGWWLTRMLQGPHPLREKMTLFWHNHFATSNAKVQNPGRMFGQYELMY